MTMQYAIPGGSLVGLGTGACVYVRIASRGAHLHASGSPSLPLSNRGTGSWPGTVLRSHKLS